MDGDTSEWTDKDRVIQYEDGSFISVKYDASGVYLYLHKKDFDLENDTLYVPVDTTKKQAVPVWKIVQQNLKDLQILYWS